MKKLLLLCSVVSLGLASNAQRSLMDDRIQKLRTQEKPVVLLSNQPTSAVSHHHGNTRSVSNGMKLNEQRIGSAGNVLTVLNFNCNQLYVNDALNAVTFIHRNDPTGAAGTNIAQYRYDLSKNGGLSWTPNIGPITVSNLIDNLNVNGRFPQAAIFNPDGNNILDSAYLVYSGTWHDDPGTNTGSWAGQMRGRGQLTGTANGFNVHIDSINHGRTAVASGFCQSVPGVLWNLNTDYTGTFATGSNAITKGLFVEKGVWNPTTRDIDWTVNVVPATFDSVSATSGTSTVLESIATSFDMAFDPSGKYGWISCLGDMTNNPTDSVYHPIFWSSTDSGNTWSAPIQVDLQQLPGVVQRLHGTASSGATTSGIPTTSFQGKLAVDYLGNPHLFTTVGNGAGYSIQLDAGYVAYDINYNASRRSCDSSWNGWAATFVDSVQTFQGTYTANEPAGTSAYTDYNRPLVSRSKDGKKLFFYWVDSDINFVGSDANDAPNLFTRAFDLEHHSSTQTVNLTLGDSLFGGETVAVAGGIFQPGANYPTVSPIALQTGNSYNVPLVLTQIDYINGQAGSLGTGANPAAFWYVDNITYDPSDFTQSLSVGVQVDGANPMNVLNGTNFVDPGASILYIDTNCYPVAALHLVIDSGGLNTNVNGTYTIHYLAEDASGNVYAAGTRTVNVGAPPVADFTWTFPTFPYQARFADQSTNNPTSWQWYFYANDTTGSQARNPVKTFTANGSWNVCLIATNGFGSSAKTCKQISITGVGIDEVAFAQSINLYPNPTTGKVFISLEENTSSDITISVFNTLGENVISPAKVKAGTTKVEMDASSLASGMYLVKIQTAEGTAVKQLTISHR